MAFTHTAAVVGRRACAALAVCSAALHGLMLGHPGQPLIAMLLLVAMLAVCLYCAWELWTNGSLRAWCLVALMNLGMVAVHMTGWHDSAGHRHGAVGALTATVTPSVVLTAATTIAAIEIAAAVTVLFYRTRGRATHLAAGRG